MDERLAKAETIVFDVGNVLLSFDPERVLTLAPEALRPALREALWGEAALWGGFDLGKDGNEAVAEQVAQRVGLPGARDAVMNMVLHFHQVMDPLPLYHLLPALRQAGKRLLALTNFPEPSFSLACVAYPHLTAQLDGAVVSAREKLVKPGPAIFRVLMERYRLQPESTLYVDDTAVNAQAAAQLGFQAWHYAGHDRIW